MPCRCLCSTKTVPFYEPPPIWCPQYLPFISYHVVDRGLCHSVFPPFHYLSLLPLILIRSRPLSVPHPFHSAVKASSLVFEKIKTLPLSPPFLPHSLPPHAPSITLWMLKRNASLNISLAAEQQRGTANLCFSSCWQLHVNLKTFQLLNREYRIFFFFCCCFFCMLIKEPCWRDYSLLWKLWRSLNVIICSASLCVLIRNGEGFGAFSFARVSELLNSVSHCEVCLVRWVDSVKVRSISSHVLDVRRLIALLLREILFVMWLFS